MDCTEARELLQEELDGRLSPADASNLAQHLASCTACAEEKRSLASLRDVFRAMPAVAAPDGFRDSVMSQLPRGRLLPSRWVIGIVSAIAATLLVVVTILHRDGSGSFAERVVSKAVPQAPRHGVNADEEADADSTQDGFASRRAENAAKKAAGAKEKAADDAGSSGAPAGGDLPKGYVPPDTRMPADAPTPASEPALSNVRYVVFHDENAAEAFASKLSEVAKQDREKGRVAAEGKTSRDDKDARGGPSTPAGGAAAPAVTAAPPAAPPPTVARKAGLSAEKLRTQAPRGRIVARTTLPGASADTTLARSVEAAGGSLVTGDAAVELAKRLPPPAAPRPAPQAAKQETAPPPPEEAGSVLTLKKDEAAADVVVIVVVVDEAHPPADAAK